MTHSVTARLATVRQLATSLGNSDSPGEERAAAALILGTPAYWWKGTATSGTLPLWRDYANEYGGIKQGLATYRGDFGRKTVDPRLTLAFLDKLIPLNAAAADDLGSAYFSLCATFYSSEELEKRNPFRARRAVPAIAV